MSPAKSIEEALRRLEEEEKKTQQKTTVLREELLQVEICLAEEKVQLSCAVCST